MLKFLRYAVLALVALGLVTFAMANRAPAPVRLLPDDLAALTGLVVTLDVPVWVILFSGLVIGLVVGFVWEWLREHGHRRAARSGQKQVKRLEQELAVMKDSAGLPDDDILALIDKPRPR